MKKCRMFIDPLKEEKWLNEMIKKGWVCKKVNMFGIYEFEETKFTDYVIRFDFQSFHSTDSYEQYVELHEDDGWYHIGGSRWTSQQYWAKLTDGLDELFSDNASEKAYLQHLTKYYGIVTIFFVLMTVSLFNNSLQYLNLKSAYFTPGLWNKEGVDFFTAFLFETPFALLRFISPWFIIICGIMFLKTYLKYNKTLKEMV